MGANHDSGDKEVVMITGNFTPGSCKESLWTDEKGRFILTYANINAIPKVLTWRQISVWFAERYLDE